MAAKKKSGTKLELKVSGNQAIEGSKEKLYTVTLKKGSSQIPLGQFLARTETEAKKKARAVVRAAL